MQSDLEEVAIPNHLLGSQDPNKSSLPESKLYKIVYFLNHITHRISMLILFLLMLLTTADVIGRYFFNKPITGAYELTSLGLVILIFFSLGMAQITKDHITIDFLTSKFPMKIQEALHALMTLVLLILLILTSWQLIEYAKRFMNGNQVSGDLSIPMYIFAFLAAMGIMFFSLTLLLDIVKSVMRVVQKDES